MLGKIIKIVSNQYTLLLDNKNIVISKAMGKVRLDKTPKVGDLVNVINVDDAYYFDEIKQRKNELIRPSIANIDQAIVVMSAHEPDFSTSLVDRICFLINQCNIEPIICITKMDLVKDLNDPIYTYIEDYQKCGYQVLLCSTDTIDENMEYVLKDKVTVLTGQSGVGKSSLLNSLDPNFMLNTQEISKALGRGKHTTRHVELHLVKDGWVADTPGFSSLDFSNITPNELALSVKEFRPYLGKCKFNDCIHENEPGCAIKAALNDGSLSKIRYQNYIDVLKVVKERRKF